MVSLFLLLSCSDAQKSIAEVNDGSDVVMLTPTRRLARASLDIRGVLPSLEEHNQIIADPDSYEMLVEAYLQDPNFGNRIREIYGSIYTTEKDTYPVNPEVLNLDPYTFSEAIGQEPLRIIQKVAEDDLPWSTIVTANWTMANEVHASIYPIDYPADASGWQQVQYTDGRPSAGVLSTNGLWWVYGSTVANGNRKRANTVSRLLLCQDYLMRPISFERDIDLLDGEAIETAIQTDPACINCHNTLDPLAAHFFGFWSPLQNSWLDLVSYHPERELLYSSILGVQQSYYGQPSNGLGDLGLLIANDERFGMCAVRQMIEHFHQTDSSSTDIDRLIPHRNAFIEGGQTMRSLIRSIVLSPEYSTSRWDEEHGDRNARLLHVDQLASSIEDLTGFRWTYDGLDILRSGTIGLRVLAGGSDGETVYEAATTPSPTMLLTQARLAELAAAYAVDQESEQPHSDRMLFTLVDLDNEADPQITQQIQQLHLQVLSLAVDSNGPEVNSLLDLYNVILTLEEDPKSAWKGVLTALLRDPNLLIY